MSNTKKLDTVILLITLGIISVYLYISYTKLFKETLMEEQIVFINLYNVLQSIEYTENSKDTYTTFLALWEERLKQLGVSRNMYMNSHMIKKYLYLMKEYINMNNNGDKNLLDLCDKLLSKITLYTMLYNALYFILALLGMGCFVYMLNYL